MDSLNDALISCVKAAGGSKQVGPLLWPEKTPDSAQRLLLDCLNEDRPAKLSPEHFLMILRLSRGKGHHEAVNHILSDLGYAPTSPIEPKDEAAELQRQFIESAHQMQMLAARIERLQPALRVAA